MLFLELQHYCFYVLISFNGTAIKFTISLITCMGVNVTTNNAFYNMGI